MDACDSPPAPQVEELPSRSEDHSMKLHAIRGELKRLGLAGVLIKTAHNFAWATSGGRNNDSIDPSLGVAALWVGIDIAAVITSNAEANRLRETELRDLEDLQVVEHNWWEGKSDDVVVTEQKWAEEGSWETDQNTDMASSLDALRTSLGFTPREMGHYKALGKDCGTVIGEVINEIHETDSEATITAQLRTACERATIEPVTCLVTVLQSSSPRLVSLMLRGRRHGMCAAVTRCVCFGDMPEEMRAHHLAAATVDATAITSTYAGTTLGSILSEVKKAYLDAGHADKWKLRSQGGMIGYKSSELKAMEGGVQVIKPNQAFAWSAAVEGIISEDTILIGSDGEPSIITQTPKWPLMNCNIGGTVIKMEGGGCVHMGGCVVQRPEVLQR